MALEGTLRDFSLADIFQLIGIQKKTGVLTLKESGEVVTVSFLNGSVVSADCSSKNLEDRLGTVLVKSGRLTEERLQEALKRQRETHKRLGYILVHDHLITEEVLREALRLQITQIVYRLFRWKDGEYHFSQEETVDYDREHFSPISAENILMEGIRMIDEWPIIERKIPSFDLVFRQTRPGLRPTIVSHEEVGEDLDATLTGPAAPEPAPSDGVRLSREAASVYAQIDGRRTIQEIIDRVRLGDFETCRLMYDLLSRNLITLSEETAAAAQRRRRLKAGPIFEKLGYVALAGAVAVSVATLPGSPLSGSPELLAPPGSIETVNDLIARNRIDRLDEAVQIYFLQKGFYPDSLKDLAKGRLVRETALTDPWGRTFGFISTPDGYRIIAYDEGGIENVARSIVRGRPEPPPPPERRAPPSDAARLSPAGAGPQQ